MTSKSVHGVIAFSILVGCLTACTTTSLEYDRMTGTAFPATTTVGGNTVSLTSIYADADKVLNVNQDQTNIAALTGPADPNDPNKYDYITEAELNTIETANRTVPVDVNEYSCGFWIFSGTCRTYYLYGIVVNHWYERINGTRSTGTLGIMWATDNRRAFASFYKNGTVSGNNAKYLRSTAHEIGHAYNLHHQEGDGSRTIMNQTGVVGDTYDYEFSSDSEDHLDDHPRDCVYPGTGSFTSVNTAHTPHTFTTSDCP